MKSNIISSVKKNRRKVIIGAVIAAAVLAAGIISYYVYEHIYYVYTDDARVMADIVKLNSQKSGKLLEFNVEEGDAVTSDQILGRQDIGSSSDSSIEKSLIRSPIDGIIVKKEVNSGENISPDRTMALLADPEDYYIIANIDETKTRRLQSGQTVDISVDEYGNQKFTGKVESIGKMSQTALKSNSYSDKGKYKRTVQKVSVKIKFSGSSNLKSKFTIGENAAVKIHVVNDK